MAELKMRRCSGAVLVLGSILLSVAGCQRTESQQNAVPSEKPNTERKAEPAESVQLRIAVGSIITPREGFAYYRDLLQYVEKKLGRSVGFVDRKTYAEVNALLKSGEVDAAFICGGPYVEGHADFALEVLVVPQVRGKTVYHSNLIVSTKSKAKTLEDLRGGTFAFTDSSSNTGKLVPTYLLAQVNETPESFFKKHVFTYAHDKSIKAVADNLVDAAAVHSLIWDYLLRKEPGLKKKVKVIWQSPPYGIPPFVVRPGLDAKTKAALERILKGAHEDEAAKPLLKGMGIDKFVNGADSTYNSIRRMQAWVAQKRSAAGP